jgi:C4-dicarboxylate-specific signal transduction histidine kinase
MVLKAELLRRSLSRDTQCLASAVYAKQAQTVIDMGQRIATIVIALKTFAREGGRDPVEDTAAETLVSHVLALCGTRLRNLGIDLRVVLPEEPSSVPCQAVQIEQVLLNLINNAVDAMEGCAEKWIRVEVRDLEGAVEWRVSNSGPPIPPEIASKIMQPFFTTKPPGRGTGLGLSISRGIAESHRGILEYAEAASHTTFVLSLPKAPRALDEDAGLAGRGADARGAEPRA